MQPLKDSFCCHSKLKVSPPPYLGWFAHPLRVIDILSITRIINDRNLPELGYKKLYSATLRDKSIILVTKAATFTLCTHLAPDEEGRYIERGIDPFYADLIKVVWKERMNLGPFK